MNVYENPASIRQILDAIREAGYADADVEIIKEELYSEEGSDAYGWD